MNFNPQPPANVFHYAGEHVMNQPTFQQGGALEDEDRNLSIFDQLNHANFKVRTFAYKKLGDIFAGRAVCDEVQPAAVAKTFFSWLKNIMKDSNQIALNYGLQAVLEYLAHQKPEANIVPYLINDLLEQGHQQKKKIVVS